MSCDKLLEIVLKGEQKEPIIVLLRGEDLFAVLPTGFGKRLIYKLFVEGKRKRSATTTQSLLYFHLKVLLLNS